MSARKTTHSTAAAPSVVAAAPRPRKKTPRARLTHVEVRRGENLRLRIAIADDAMAEVGHELGALIKKIAPSAEQPAKITTPVAAPVAAAAEPDFIVSRIHVDHDATYHTQLREHLVELFGSLCETGLEDALDAVRKEIAKRAEGTN